MIRLFALSLISFLFIISSALCSSAEMNLIEPSQINESFVFEVAKKDRLFIVMTKTEAYEVEGIPYRVKRLEGEDEKEMWIYRCNNDDGFDEDCLYLYFSDNELGKIERP
ncbi:MAG: hypothetical protein WBB48_11790 [Thermodesulfobacteriota bacterium]